MSTQDARPFNSGPVQVATLSATVIDLYALRGSLLLMTLQNTGGTALTTVEVLVKSSSRDTDWHKYLAGAEFEATSNNLYYSEGTPHINTCPASSSRMVIIDLRGAYAVRVRARVSSGTTTVQVVGRVAGR